MVETKHKKITKIALSRRSFLRVAGRVAFGLAVAAGFNQPVGPAFRAYAFGQITIPLVQRGR